MAKEVPVKEREKREVPIDQWTGCYEDGWQSLIVPEAFAH
jgi:hypothetical protein